MDKRLTVVNLHNVASFLGFVDVIALSATSTSLRHALNDDVFWDEYTNHAICSGTRKYRIDNAREVLKALVHALDAEQVYNVIQGTVEASSQDRPVEGPSNTLTQSRCLKCIQTFSSRSLLQVDTERLGIFAQRDCGCIGTGDSCYWSSAPCHNSDGLEYITYSTFTQAAFIAGFSVTPYQAFMHPSAPTYGPQQVCLQIVDKRSSSAIRTDTTNTCRIKRQTESELAVGVLWQSAFFHVDNLFREQLFIFPRPVLCADSDVRLVFKGMWQRQRLGPGIPEDFYLCISHCAVLAAATQFVVGNLAVIKAEPEASAGTSSSESKLGKRVLDRIAPSKQPERESVPLYEVDDLLDASEDKALCPQFLNAHAPEGQLRRDFGSEGGQRKCVIG